MDQIPSEVIPNPIDTPRQQSKWVRFLIEIIQTLILALILYFLIDSVIARVRVENISMEPTLVPGEFLLVNKLAYKWGTPRRGDIVVFHYPQNLEVDYIKRVVGLPGDMVSIRDGRVIVNSEIQDEPYISSPPEYTGDWTVNEGSLFVLGDNRNWSSDSHSWGFVPLENVVGRAMFIYWPLNKLRVIPQVTQLAAIQ